MIYCINQYFNVKRLFYELKDMLRLNVVTNGVIPEI